MPNRVARSHQRIFSSNGIEPRHSRFAEVRLIGGMGANCHMCGASIWWNYELKFVIPENFDRLGEPERVVIFRPLGSECIVNWAHYLAEQGYVEEAEAFRPVLNQITEIERTRRQEQGVERRMALYRAKLSEVPNLDLWEGAIEQRAQEWGDVTFRRYLDWVAEKAILLPAQVESPEYRARSLIYTTMNFRTGRSSTTRRRGVYVCEFCAGDNASTTQGQYFQTHGRRSCECCGYIYKSHPVARKIRDIAETRSNRFAIPLTETEISEVLVAHRVDQRLAWAIKSMLPEIINARNEAVLTFLSKVVFRKAEIINTSVDSQPYSTFRHVPILIRFPINAPLNDQVYQVKKCIHTAFHYRNQEEFSILSPRTFYANDEGDNAFCEHCAPRSLPVTSRSISVRTLCHVCGASRGVILPAREVCHEDVFHLFHGSLSLLRTLQDNTELKDDFFFIRNGTLRIEIAGRTTPDLIQIGISRILEINSSANPPQEPDQDPDQGQRQFTYRAEQLEVTIACPTCRRRMVRRTGPYGEFYGCSTFPVCCRTVRLRDAQRMIAAGEVWVAADSQMPEPIPIPSQTPPLRGTDPERPETLFQEPTPRETVPTGRPPSRPFPRMTAPDAPHVRVTDGRGTSDETSDEEEHEFKRILKATIAAARGRRT